MCLCIVNYALKESSKLCVMSMSSNEHARNVDAKLTHTHNDNAKFSNKEIYKSTKL